MLRDRRIASSCAESAHANPTTIINNADRKSDRAETRVCRFDFGFQEFHGRRRKMEGKPILAGSDEGVTFRVVNDRVRALATSEDTGGAYEIFELRGPRESGPPLHSHPWDEAYVMIEGEAEVTVGDRKMTMTPGCFVNAPRGTLHAYRIFSDEARFVVVTSPAGASDFFADLDRETQGSTEDLARILGVALRHGLSVPLPPPSA
jgi:quercetin dioxygenase-like cupin family protein